MKEIKSEEITVFRTSDPHKIENIKRNFHNNKIIFNIYDEPSINPQENAPVVHKNKRIAVLEQDVDKAFNILHDMPLKVYTSHLTCKENPNICTFIFFLLLITFVSVFLIYYLLNI